MTQSTAATGDRRRYIALIFGLNFLPFAVNGFYNPTLQHLPWAYWSADVFIFVVMPILLIGWGFRKGLYTWTDLGLSATIGRGGNRLLFPIVLVVGIPVLCVLEHITMQVAFDCFPPKPATFSYGDQVAQSSANIRLLKLVYFALTAGIVEEMYYRGMLRLLFKEGGAAPALFVVISTVLFIIPHWENGLYGMTIALFWGLIAALFYEITRNLWPLILSHIIVDLIAFS